MPRYSVAESTIDQFATGFPPAAKRLVERGKLLQLGSLCLDAQSIRRVLSELSLEKGGQILLASLVAAARKFDGFGRCGTGSFAFGANYTSRSKAIYSSFTVGKRGEHRVLIPCERGIGARVGRSYLRSDAAPREDWPAQSRTSLEPKAFSRKEIAHFARLEPDTP